MIWLYLTEPCILILVLAKSRFRAAFCIFVIEITPTHTPIPLACRIKKGTENHFFNGL